MEDHKITSFQFFVIVIFFTVGTSIFNIPSALASGSHQDAWIAAIVGTVLGVFVIWIYTFIGFWFPNLTHVQLKEKVFGKWIGKFFSLFLIMMAILYSASLLVHSGFFLKTQMFPNTPMVMLNALLTLIVVMGVRLGLNTIGRSAEILIFVFFFLFILLVSTILPNIEIQNIEPVFETDVKSIFSSSLIVIIISSVNAIVLLMIFPALIRDRDRKKAKKYFLIGNIIGGLVIIIVTLLCIFVLGSNTTERQLYPSYALAKTINIGNFINRIEGFMAALWILAIYFKLVIYFFAGTLGLSQVLNLKDYRPLIYPLGIIIVALSLVIHPNNVYMEHFDATTSLALSVLIGVILQLILIIVYLIRKKQFKKSIDSSQKENLQ